MRGEFGWGDGIYSGAAHLVATHRRPKHQPLTYDHAYCNSVHAWFRSRAEHWFAHLWHFNVVKNVWTGRGEEGVLKLANRIRVLMHFVNFWEKRKRKYQSYGPWPPTHLSPPRRTPGTVRRAGCFVGCVVARPLPPCMFLLHLHTAMPSSAC